MASNTPAGVEGFYLLSFLTGERSPNWNPNVRAALYGLDFHMVQAILLVRPWKG
ncbi:hypothetical protein [Desulfitobacterium sp. AusDCA]|uniref:hypothetical protein n=1 Tax=Desulfitobacterium sp. AusDCA TaxID=3240383 RepID=UPI003DA78CD4